MGGIGAEFDQRFGEALYQQLMNYCEKYVRIETEVLGIERAGEILSLVGIERLRRFRKEYLMREFTATVESMSRGNQQALENNAIELSISLQSESEEETRRKIMRSYYGE
jgi:hypothetical protein